MLLSEYPNLISEWDYSKNKEFEVSTITAGSKKKVWWTCSSGHSWQAIIKNRAGRGSGCPYCNNKLALAGFTDLATVHPELVKEWDYEKNTEFSPTEVLPRSNKKVWWRCKKGHEWEAVIATRTRKNPCGCPVCSGQKVLVNYNDLASQFPLLLAEWDYTKNLNLDPTLLNKGSEKKVWWKCANNHEWQARVINRTKQGQGCPYCSGRVPVIGINDLAARYPNLLHEWDYEKNIVLPSELSQNSSKRVWWRCSKGHSWKTVVRYRTENGSGCPTCWSKTFVSKAEQELLEYVQSLKSNAIGTYKQIPNVSEVDIFVPSSNIAIEYNGIYFHSDRTKHKTYHQDKWRACKDQGIQLIQIWEDDWINKKDVVKRMIAHKLGVSSEPRVYARNTEIVQVNADQAEMFLEANHIQGYVRGSIRIGLEYNGELVALALFKKRTDTSFELVRYATSCTVVGGQGKILKNLVNNYPEIKEIVTFADHCVSNGGLYEQLNFVNDGEIKPDYKYLVNNRRIHKFSYRLKRFKNDEDLLYYEGLTEFELADLNGLRRIYDAGKTRYIFYT